MNPGKPINKFAKQLVAWSAIAMLFLQPLGLSGYDCGCGSVNVQEATTEYCCSMDTPEKSCCRTSEKTCCSTSDKVNNAPCKCGDHCRCSMNQPGKPLPVIPVNESQSEQSQSLALTSSVWPTAVSQTESKFGGQTFSVVRLALTAQQTCALLSRFIV